MPIYLVAALVVVAAIVVFFVTKKKQPPTPPPTQEHQGNFQGIFPSQYGGNTYEMTQSAGVVLFCTQGPSQGKEFPFPVGGVLGSSPQSQVLLPNEDIVATLVQDGGAYVVRSTNGKKFSHNDQPTLEARLTPGDTLTFGKHVVKVQVNS